MAGVNDEYMELLHDFESLPEIISSESIFDIAGYPHYENVCSNILAFYLNPYNEHGLRDLFLSSLLKLLGKNGIDLGNVQVSREVSTDKGGRLDIVVETDNQIIGIENKIFHYLNNNLDDYSKTIEKWASLNQLDTVKVVLSIRKEFVEGDFVNVTYREYWKEIKESIGSKITTSSQKWLLYLVDFMSTVEKISGGNMDVDEKDQFFIENEDRINSLINTRNKFVSKLNGRIRELANLIQKPESCERQWIYAKSCLVHDYNISGNSIAFDLHISPQGWELQLFGRDAKSQEYLDTLCSISDLSGDVEEKKDGRYILERYELSSELNIIKDSLTKWFERLRKSVESKGSQRGQSRLKHS